MAEKEAEVEVERIYVIPLRRAKIGRSSLAAPRAVKEVRTFIIKHMKVDTSNVWIDDSLNKHLWSQGKYKIPSKIRVRVVKFDDGVVEVTLPEIGEKKSRRELLKEEREKKTPILKRDEEGIGEQGEQPDIAGTGDYDITPSADGDVKIKKKKAPKAEKSKDEKPKEKKKPAKKQTTKDAKKDTKKATKKDTGEDTKKDTNKKPKKFQSSSKTSKSKKSSTKK